MKKQLLLSTGNPGKLGEMRIGLKPLSDQGWQLLSLNEVGIVTDPEETGATFQENALLKAQFYAQQAGIPALSDDGGFVIPVLNYEPGVRSRRWLGRESTDQELIDYTLKKMQPFQGRHRRAYLELVLCFYDPAQAYTLYENEKINGTVAFSPATHRVEGFPYRALLKVEPYHKYYDELSEAEHQSVNHRLRALAKLTPKLIKHYAKT